MSYQDNEYMQQALRLGHRGIYTTTPNPNVGCVMVKDGQVVGQGYHRRAGEAHAEVIALQQAGDQAEGATVYVTLEPCAHTGRTPPCTDALIAAKVGRVVVAMTDPNPLVAGTGLEKLRQAGIEVDTGLMEQQARALNPGFIKRMQQQRPWIRVKMAMSLDGRTALASGESQWITGEAARADVQRLRARSCAVMTGIGTVLADNPTLNVRLTPAQLGIDGSVRQPVRVVLDENLQISSDATILRADGDTIVMTTSSSRDRDSLNCTVMRVEAADAMLDLERVLDRLGELEINEVHVEAGPTLSGALLHSRLVDELIIYMAPHLMGHEARALFTLPGINNMKQRISLDITDVRSFANDLRITAKPVYEGP